MLKLEGPNAFKYMAVYWIWNVIVWIAWIFSALVPYGKQFLNVLQIQLNAQKWDLSLLVVPILWIIGYWVLCQILIIIVALFLYKLFRSANNF